MYIEKYTYDFNFDVVNFFSQFKKGIDYDPNWPIVMVSNSRLDLDAFYSMMDKISAGNTRRSKPSVCLSGSVDSVRRAIVKILGMTGITFSVESTCTSGAYALYQALLISAAHGTPVVVACSDIFTSMEEHLFGSLGAVSHTTGIPFDINSKGFRPGNGQAFFIVSHKPINPVAEIPTMRFMTQPDEKTGVGSIDDLYNQMFTNLDLSNISWWNAHAPGTPMGDNSEYKLFEKLGLDIPISSIKGHIGHILASSYLVELAVGLDSVGKGSVIGNKGIVTPINNDPRIIQSDVKMNTKSFLKFNMGFGGKNVLTLIKSLV